jgi:hypothetical protein
MIQKLQTMRFTTVIVAEQNSIGRTRLMDFGYRTQVTEFLSAVNRKSFAYCLLRLGCSPGYFRISI